VEWLRCERCGRNAKFTLDLLISPQRRMAKLAAQKPDLTCMNHLVVGAPQ